MPESVRPPERVATVPQVKERSPREERAQGTRREQPPRKPSPAAREPMPDEEAHALDVEV